MIEEEEIWYGMHINEKCTLISVGLHTYSWYWYRFWIFIHVNRQHILSVIYIELKGGSRTGTPGICFCKFWMHNTYNWCQHAMFTLCILFCTLTKKNIGYMWRGYKAIPKPQEFYRTMTVPRFWKFLDPPLYTKNQILVELTYTTCKKLSICEFNTLAFLFNSKLI